MSTRVQTYFGIPIPPFKQKKLGAGSSTIRFVLKGNIISKKNNEQAVSVRKYARKFIQDCDKAGFVTTAQAMKGISMVYAKIRGNPEYLKFVEAMQPVLMEQMQFWSARLRDKGLIFPINKASVNVRLYIKDKYRRDTVNAQQTIQDLFKDCGVITDDNDQVLNPIYAESARYYEELIYNIAFISLSFNLKSFNEPNDN